MKVQNQLPNIDPYWKFRGLTMIFLGNKLLWQAPEDGKTLTVVNGPKLVSSKFGLSSGFGTTYGTGLTDRLDGGVLPRPLTKWRSIVSHYYALSGGGGGLGRIFQDISGTGTSAGESLYLNNGFVQYVIACSSTFGSWYSFNTYATGRWQSFGLTHDQRTVNVSPEFYMDGSSIVPINNSAASGSYQTTPCNLAWGNRPSDSLRCFDGLLGLTLFFDGRLSAADHVLLSIDPRVVFSTPLDYFLYQSSSIINGSASGNPTLLTLVSPVGSSIGNASIICPFTDTLDFSLPTISATGGVSCSGSLDEIDLTAPTGTATATGDAVASGSFSNLTFTVVTGNSSGDANIVGYFSDELDFTSLTGSAFSSVSAVGNIAELTLTVPTGEAVTEVAASGDLSPLSLSNVFGDGVGSGNSSGNLSELFFVSILGTSTGSATGLGNTLFLSLTPPLGSAIGINQHDATVSGNLSTLLLSAPNGHAAELAIVEDDSEYILVYSKGSGIRYVPVTPGARKILSSF